MAGRRVVGVFDTVEAAERAKRELVDGGIPAGRIDVSTSLTADAIAGEAPGQSFENQPGQARRGAATTRYEASMRAGTCVLSVDPRSGEEAPLIERLLRLSGARDTARSPD